MEHTTTKGTMFGERQMSDYPIKDPTRLEKMLFDAHLVVKVSLAEIYDIKARTSIQREWQDPDRCATTPDVHDPNQWDDKLHACMRGEFFAHVLAGCRRVLDVGCGEGWPSLYIARTLPQVVGVDVSPEHIALARNTARIMNMDNVRFEVANIENLPFAEQSFDAVSFGGNVFTYGFDTKKMLREIHRVLLPVGLFAFEQRSAEPARAPFERIGFFIDVGPPILHYVAGSGLFSRSWFIYLKSESAQGGSLSALAKHMSGALSQEQREACEDIKRGIEDGNLDCVEKAMYSGEDRSLAAHELAPLLQETGFVDVRSWALPNAVIFARSLQEYGVLQRLRSGDLLPCLRALVKSALICPGWAHDWVTCKKG
jgi:ubiquinone/menaquinone biosynthesis C-methylase UbiE